MLNVMSCALEVIGPCNYSCYYCLGDFDKKREWVEPVLHNLKAVERYYGMFLQVSKSVLTSFYCRGAEPLIHSQIVPLLNISTEAGIVVLHTSLCRSIKEWMPAKPASLYIVATLHPEAEDDLDEFTKHSLEVAEVGGTIKVKYVGHPYQLHKMAKYRDHFTRAGLTFGATPCRGTYQGKEYPFAYTDEELAILGIPRKTIQRDYVTRDQLTEMKAAIIPPKENLCIAGWKSVTISPTSELQRCHHDKTPLNYLFTSSTPCHISCSKSMQMHDGREYIGIYKELIYAR